MGLSCFKSWKYDSTGRKGSNRDVLASPGSYFFLSNSCGQGEEWLNSLNKGVWIPFTGVFGQRLEETVLYERRYGARVVPLVVEQCVAFIRDRGLQEVGLFRQPGQATLVKELQEAFDAGEKPSFDSSTDVHTVASLLKLYLRQLPEPLVPYSRYQDFLLCGQKLSSERTQGLMELRSLLHDLPVANFNLLNYICQFLNEVQSYSVYNKMSCQNLATVFGPNILRAKAEDPHSIIGGAAVVQQLMLELIREQPSLFSCRPPAPPASCSAQPAAAGGGVSCTSPPSSSGGGGGAPCRHAQQQPVRPQPRPLPRPSVCSRQLSLPLISLGGGARPGSASSTSPAQSSTDQPNPSCVPPGGAADSMSQKRLRGHRYTSSHPENCFSPLPSTSYLPPPQHHHVTAAELDYQHHLASNPAFSAVSGVPTAASTASSSLQSEDPAFGGSKLRPALRGWAEARPNLGATEEAACFWASGTRRGATGVDGVMQGTASGGSSSDALDDSTLSVYDNLDRASLGEERMDDVVQRFDGRYFETDAAAGHHQGSATEEVGRTIDSASSWSSCEIIPLDEGGEGGGESLTSSPMRRSPGFASNRGSEDDKDDDDDDDDGDDKDAEDNDRVDDDEEDEDDDIFHPNTPESSSSSGPTDERLSTGSSEVFLPSSDLQESSDLQDLPLLLLQKPQEEPVEDVHSLLVELRQQMAKQEVEYQARIHSLERCNDALQGQVRVLRASLEQQKRWHSVAEIKIRNVERARADADRRNATLQREMEHFFRMFGEISGGGAEGRTGERFVQSF